eukprot:1092430-Lingulodinium_polyedra.AAC.1
MGPRPGPNLEALNLEPRQGGPSRRPLGAERAARRAMPARTRCQRGPLGPGPLSGWRTSSASTGTAAASAAS